MALVEWGDLAAPVFGREVLTVDLAVDGEEGRVITVSGALAEGRRAQLGDWSA